MTQLAFLPTIGIHPSSNFCAHPVLTASTRCSLQTRRVLVTAPLHYAARLSPCLLSREIRPLIAPTITTTPLLDQRASSLEDALLRLQDYDVLAFVSRMSVSSVASLLRGLCGGDDEVAAIAMKASGVRIAALGADAQAVKHDLGCTTDIVPLDPSPSGLVRFLAADHRLKGASILCPVPLVTGMAEPDIVPNFLKELRDAGFNVNAVPAYETRPVERQSLAVELGLLGSVDGIIVSSTGEAIALHSLLTEPERTQLLERAERGDIVFAAHGPVTAAGVRDVFSVSPLVSDNYGSFDGVADMVCRELSKGNLILPS